jgi:hypothetical protein
MPVASARWRGVPDQALAEVIVRLFGLPFKIVFMVIFMLFGFGRMGLMGSIMFELVKSVVWDSITSSVLHPEGHEHHALHAREPRDCGYSGAPCRQATREQADDESGSREGDDE